jgi:type I restriction-modification system DNA methylase subunit
MGEDLIQAVPQQLGKYTYHRLGSATVGQLRDSGIIPKKRYDSILTKKPDGLVVYHRSVKAVVEYKQPKELSTEKQISKAIAQELAVAKALCKILIVTDGTKSFWINAINGERVRDEKGAEVRAVFHPKVVKGISHVEYLIGEIDASLTARNSIIRSAKLIDPTPIATRLWQTIWVATGKAPVKCLYNVVELFIFKFLSDLGVLGEDIAFDRIREKANVDPSEGLDFYAKNSRRRMFKLFPPGRDGTTIINGTIFVNEEGEANTSQSYLFRRSLDHLWEYAEEFGKLTKIDKQFKTRLYECFLKQEVEALGQYFTPRKVVQSMIRMAGLDSPTFRFEGTRICDPFCGVGGFPLELLNMNEDMWRCYRPGGDGKITLPFVLHGFDKGFEREDERTIILAKANMLIYLAELLFAYPHQSAEFARAFNETFSLFRDNLGTFGHIIKDEADKYDVILSNPPYVTRGSSIIKEEIRKTADTKDQYPINALGLEGLAVEWIIKALRPGGRAFFLIPDGILARVGGKKLRNHILRECYLNAIVSLPVRTFFANAKHTYILAITKKRKGGEPQSESVFTYLASNIGERLTSVKREEIDADDLPEMEAMFRVFLSAGGGAKALLEGQSGRCKLQDIAVFQREPHWVIDRWWTQEELIKAGAAESAAVVSQGDIGNAVDRLSAALADYHDFVSSSPLDGLPTRVVALGDTNLFSLSIGERVLTKDTVSSSDRIPVYSANVFKPMGMMAQSNITDFARPRILWGIDGNFEFNLIQPGIPFATTDHCGTIEVLDARILPKYVLYALYHQRAIETFDRSFRANLENMGRFTIPVPTDGDGNFDVDCQRKIAARFTSATEKRGRLEAVKSELDRLFKGYISTLSM